MYPVPDGDTGTNMARTLDAVVAELELADARARSDVQRHQPRQPDGRPRQQRRDPQPDPARVGRNVEGRRPTLSATRLPKRLKAASAAAYQAVLKPIEGTILTVVRESADAGASAAADGASLVGMLRAARAAGKAALDNTPELLPGAEGRRGRRCRRRRLPAVARRRAARGRRRAVARTRRG